MSPVYKSKTVANELKGKKQRQKLSSYIASLMSFITIHFKVLMFFSYDLRDYLRNKKMTISHVLGVDLIMDLYFLASLTLIFPYFL